MLTHNIFYNMDLLVDAVFLVTIGSLITMDVGVKLGDTVKMEVIPRTGYINTLHGSHPTMGIKKIHITFKVILLL